MVRKVWQYPSVMEPTPLVTIRDIGFSDSQSVNVTFYKDFLYPSYMAPVKDPTQIDQWVGSHPDYIFKAANFNHLYPTTPTIDAKQLTLPENPQVDKWIGYHPDYLFRPGEERYLYQSFTIDSKQLTLPERVQLDKFIGYHPDYIFRASDIRQLYPNLFEPVMDPNQIDQWIPQKPDILWDLKRQQYTYPNFFIDSKILTQLEAVSVDKWVGNHPDILFRPKDPRYYYQSSWDNFSSTFTAETITIDKWFKETEIPQWDLKRWQYLYPNMFPNQILPPTQVAVFSSNLSLVIYTQITQYQSLAFPVQFGTPSPPVTPVTKAYRHIPQMAGRGRFMAKTI